MAEGLFRDQAKHRNVVPLSAGLSPKDKTHPLAIKVMAEIGVDISKQNPKHVSKFLGKEAVHAIIVVCSDAEKNCPRIWPGLSPERKFFWPIQDPEVLMEKESIDHFRECRDLLSQKIKEWLDQN